jgi:hypothetical protein
MSMHSGGFFGDPGISAAHAPTALDGWLMNAMNAKNA